MESDLSEYTICQLMGLIGLPLSAQLRCTQQLEKLTGEVFLLDELSSGLPDDEIRTLLDALQQDETSRSGTVSLARLPILETRMRMRLEAFVVTLVREEIKFLIDQNAEDDFSQKLLWPMLPMLRNGDWHGVAQSMGYLAAKDRIPQNEGLFLWCFEVATDHYHEKEHGKDKK